MIVSVLESLRANLETILRCPACWRKCNAGWLEGMSLFARQWEALLGASPAPVPDTG